MTYTQQRAVAIGIAVVLACLGAIEAANADTLGITPRVSAWLSILSVGLGIVAGYLPSFVGRARDPKFLEHRINELSVPERKRLATRLANHATVEARLTLAQQADDERRVERIAESRIRPPHG